MLTLQFIPHVEIEFLDSDERVEKLLSLAKKEKIILLEGRLKSDEEAELIRRTMEAIDKKFKGIELSVIYPDQKYEAILKKIRAKLINILLGERSGMTIIGPAAVVKNVKKDPEKISLLLKLGR